MSKELKKIPVVFVIFNRPDLTKESFESIKQYKPTKLFIVGDGPRNTEEAIVCNETKNIVLSGIDWSCEVHTNFSDTNLGCKDRVSSGITWAFSHPEVDTAIIIEDDCVANQSFFPFCGELLEKYKDNHQIMMISGNNYREDKIDTSYFFTKMGHYWGWATWKRAWNLYDHHMSGWGMPPDWDCLQKLFKDGLLNRRAWTQIFNNTFSNKVISWGYRWSFSIWKNNGICIAPSNNLVRNTGFDERATHTKNKDHHLKFYLDTILSFPLIHPEDIQINVEADKFVEHRLYTHWLK